MNELLPMITERDGIPVTTSRAVAEQFGKQHKNVIQAIEGLRATLDETEDGNAFNRLNFQPVIALIIQQVQDGEQGAFAQGLRIGKEFASWKENE